MDNYEFREAIIKSWFDMWLRNKSDDIDKCFSKDAVYIESWGPKYVGTDEIRHWFKEWNTRGKVTTWVIKQYFHKSDQTIVEWYFENIMNDGKKDLFDGISLIKWIDGKICYLKEFGCNIENYNPYKTGGTPIFSDEKPKWF